MRRLLLILLCTLPLVTLAEEAVRDTVYACKDGLAQYNGRNYTPGTYTVRRTGQPDIILSVIETPRYNITVTDTIFVGDSYIYKGAPKTYSSVGTNRWTDELKTFRNCDSIVNHVLVVRARPTTTSTFEVHICKGDSAQVAGRWYKTKGSHSVTLKGANRFGGDSILSFRVYVHTSIVVTDSISVLQGTERQWYFHRFSDLPAGTHRLTSSTLLHTAYGCDSLEVLYVTVLPRTAGHDVLHLCDGEVVEKHGMTFSSNGDYELHIPNTAGGDSALSLSVRVHHPADTSISATIAYGDTITLCDTVLRELPVGTASFSRQCSTVWGCDSIVRLDLTVVKAKQHILWAATRDTVAVGHIIPLEATSTASLPVVYTVSPEHLVAWTDDGSLVAQAVGWLDVTAAVPEDDSYLPATATRRFVIVRRTALPEVWDSAKSTADPFKCLIDGKLRIFSSGSWYDFTGREVR